MLISTEAEMIELGRRASAWAAPGRVVRLIGPLGAGKTTFARGFLRGLGFDGEVRSPTYNLIHEYPTDPPACHVDLYRLDGPEQVADLGLEDYMTSHVILVEWAERAGDALKGVTLKFEIVGTGREVAAEGVEL